MSKLGLFLFVFILFVYCAFAYSSSDLNDEAVLRVDRAAEPEPYRNRGYQNHGYGGSHYNHRPNYHHGHGGGHYGGSWNKRH